MSREEIQALSDEEIELARKLEEIRQKKAALVRIEEARVQAEKLAAELEKPIVVRIKSREGGMILTQADSRPDLLEVWRTTPGRYFRSPDLNLIPVREFDSCLAKISNLPNCEVKWENGVKEQIDWYLNAPTWTVDLEGRRGGIFITAKPGPETNKIVNGINHIPGASWDYEALDWTFPQSEGWRVRKTLDGIAGVVYSAEANELILEQITKRARLDQIALKVFNPDGEVPDEFLGLLQGEHPPKLFQYWAAKFAEETGGQVLIGADTGLGKTWIAILYLEYLRAKDPKSVFVINVNAANIPNWEREIKRLAGVEAFVCSNYHKTPIRAMKELLPHNRGKNFNYFIISHDTLGSYEETAVPGQTETAKVYMWQMYFMQAKVDAMVIDEAHKLKNPETNRFKAIRPLASLIPKRITLTATPVLNRTSELWTQLHFLDPIMFNSYQGFLDRYTVDGKVPKNVPQLHELLRPMMLRIKKSDVIKDFPEVNRIEVIHELTDDAKLRYDEALQGLYRQLAMFNPANEERFTVIHHILHQFNALKQICAGDKAARTAELAQEIMDEANGEAGEKKVLIFSHWLGVANQIAKLLPSDQTICTVKETPGGFTTLNMTERDALFERARNDKNIKYLVTTEASGTGMNMEYVWWTIFNDPFWTPAGHRQCEGRAQRISNLHELDAFYLRANTQIEEWNFELLMQKMEIIDATVDSVEMTRDASESVLMELIRKVKEDMWQKGIR